MEAQKDHERQLAHKRASDPALNFPNRHDLKAEKERQLELIIRNLEENWHALSNLEVE